MSQRIDYCKVSSGGIKAYSEVYSYISQCGLEDSLIDHVNLRVSQLNGCAYCLDMHTRALTKNAFTPAKLALVHSWNDAEDVFTIRERAALE